MSAFTPPDLSQEETAVLCGFVAIHLEKHPGCQEDPRYIALLDKLCAALGRDAVLRTSMGLRGQMIGRLLGGQAVRPSGPKTSG